MNRNLVIAIAGLLMLCACGKKESEAESASKPPESTPGKAQQARISPEAAKEAGIELLVAGPAPVHEILPLYGVIQPNAEHVRNVSARFPGVVKSVRKAAGETVKPGEVLATVESNDSLQTYPVTAPIGGVITTRSANPGESVADQPLFVITDLSTVWVQLTLFQKDLVRIHLGQNVRVKAVDGGLTGSARVTWVSSVGESASQSVTARALLSNATRQWKPGLYVSGEVALSESVVPVAVKTPAVQTMDEHTVVFVPTDSGYEARKVRLGRSDNEVVEVLDGLKAGDKYVSANSFVIKAEIEKGSAGQEQD